MSETLLVSVIIPTHNRGDLLRRAILSVMAQDEQNFEILVCDDASEEDLTFVTNAFDDARIKLLRNAKKSHAGGARNLGLDNAKGEYIAFLDSDDEWLPDHLSSRIAEMKAKNVDGVYGSAYIFDGEERVYHCSPHIAWNQHPADYVLSGGIIPTPTWVMKATAAKTLRFDPDLIIHEDYDFFVRFAEKFKWFAMWQPTTIVHWEKGVVRKRNPYSEILYVQRYYKVIAHRTYFLYHFSNLTDYIKLNADKKVLEYYHHEALRYIYALSFSDYCCLFPQRKGFTGFFVNLFGFFSRILAEKFRKLPPPKPLLP